MRNYSLAASICCGLLALGCAPAAAQSATETSAVAPAASSDPFSGWLDMVTATQAEQPHWMTPLVTVTPRLEQEVRADFDFERLPGSKGTLDNYGNGKGVEFIPSPNVEIIVGVPPYEVTRPEQGKPASAGWGDWPMFLAKYRFYSRNEQNGNEILTGFFQVQKPTGAVPYTEDTWILQPTLAAGKGWGNFDIQATASGQFPDGGHPGAAHDYGDRVLTNVAFQYNAGVLWPEVELNDTWFASGSKEGKNQLFVTPGVIFGRFEIHGRIKAIVGIGYQMAATMHLPSYHDNLVLTTRLTF